MVDAPVSDFDRAVATEHGWDPEFVASVNAGIADLNSGIGHLRSVGLFDAADAVAEVRHRIAEGETL